MAVKVLVPEQIALTSQDSLSEGFEDDTKQKESAKKAHVQFVDAKETPEPSSPSTEQAAAGPTLMVAVKRESASVVGNVVRSRVYSRLQSPGGRGVRLGSTRKSLSRRSFVSLYINTSNSNQAKNIHDGQGENVRAQLRLGSVHQGQRSGGKRDEEVGDSSGDEGRFQPLDEIAKPS